MADKLTKVWMEDGIFPVHTDRDRMFAFGIGSRDCSSEYNAYKTDSFRKCECGSYIFGIHLHKENLTVLKQLQGDKIDSIRMIMK